MAMGMSLHSKPLQTTTPALTNIQILRAIAALLVVVYHTNSVAAKYGHDPAWLWGIQPWGTTGVDLFFVISGFIMVFIQSQRRSTPTTFMADRLLRIVPLYWLLTSTLILIIAIAPSILNSSHMDLPWAASSYVFLSQAYTGKMPVLFDGWTLEYEMFFYLVFAVALNFKKLELAVFATVSAMLVMALSTGHMIVMEFAIGMVLGLMWQNGQKPWISPAIAIALGLGLAYLAGIYEVQGNETRAWAVGIPAALIVYGCIHAPQVSPSFWTKLGDASYAIYLIQVFTIPGWYKLINHVFDTHWNVSLAMGCVAVTAAMGLLTQRLVERPMAKALKPIKQWMTSSQHASATA